MLTGVYAARNITGERYDVWSVNTEKEYHEEKQIAQPNSSDRLVPVRVQLPAETENHVQEDRQIEAAFARVDPLALGIAIGTVSSLGIFMASAVLLVQGGPLVGSTLSLLGNYLIGLEVTWAGTVFGMIEAGIAGCVVGALAAALRNWALNVYARVERWRVERDERRRLLDKM